MFTRYVITQTAYNDVKDLDNATKRRLKDKIEFYMMADNPLKYATKLKDSKAGTYRWRIGDFRVIFDTEGREKIIILRIQHRREVYRK